MTTAAVRRRVPVAADTPRSPLLRRRADADKSALAVGLAALADNLI
jgi:hypothetical protein